MVGSFIFGWIGKKTESFYKSFSGQAKFEEADRMYEDIKKRFEKHKAYFEKEANKINCQIEAHVQSINKSKRTIKTELFPAFAEKMRFFYDIPVSELYLKDFYNGSNLMVDSIKIKADLFLIDFKKNPFKSHALAIITLGFYTRKKAKETLEKVKEEKNRLEEERKRMDSELNKLKAISEALKIIAGYYSSMINLYKVLLSRLDNSVNFLIIKSLSYAHKIVHEQMSIKLLPKSQQEEIMAMWSISDIMGKMVKKNITLEGKTDIIQSNINSAKTYLHTKMEEINKQNEAA